MNLLTIGAALALNFLAACAQAAGPTPPPSETNATTAAQSESPAPSVGTATMEPDGTIVLQLRTQADDGTVAETLPRIKPGEPSYASTLQHLGGLNPGETKSVAPWPDESKR